MSRPPRLMGLALLWFVFWPWLIGGTDLVWLIVFDRQLSSIAWTESFGRVLFCVFWPLAWPALASYLVKKKGAPRG